MKLRGKVEATIEVSHEQWITICDRYTSDYYEEIALGEMPGKPPASIVWSSYLDDDQFHEEIEVDWDLIGQAEYTDE